MTTWVDALHASDGSIDDFLQQIERFRVNCHRQLVEASSWEGVLEARAQLKLLDQLARFVTMKATEDTQYGRFRRDAGLHG